MNSDYQFWILIGSQILTAGALFLQLNNKIDGLSREINEMKVEQARMEARIEGKIGLMEGRIGLMEGRLGSLEQTIRYILDCFPKPRIAIHNPQENPL